MWFFKVVRICGFGDCWFLGAFLGGRFFNEALRLSFRVRYFDGLN